MSERQVNLLLTVREVAGILKVTPDTVRDHVRAGRLAGVRPGGGRWRVHREDLDVFIGGPVGARWVTSTVVKLPRRRVGRGAV